MPINQETHPDKLERQLGSILFLLLSQFSIVLVAGTLFLISFALSPLEPIFWAQIVAVLVLIIGGFVTVLWIMWRHRPQTNVFKDLAKKGPWFRFGSRGLSAKAKQ
jgi:O-antigen/teichoic acid export membrane protein